ncbi:MAG: hypothetical protein HFJ48_05470 [Clostridia bacterium]|nr:hypothetical protein [Clostridia bacterium]
MRESGATLQKVIKHQEERKRLRLPKDLEGITEGSNSFQEDVHLLAEWFELGERTTMFEAIIKTVIKMKEISWKNIAKSLKEQGITFTTHDKSKIIMKVTKELKKTKNKTTAIIFFRILYNLQEHEEGDIEKVQKKRKK